MNISVVDYLENTVRRFPDKTAFQDTFEAFTFQQFHDAARRIGSRISQSVAPGKPIVIYMERRARDIAAFIGTAYAGCFYVPIDSHMPGERIKLIFDCLEPSLIICDDKTEASALEFSGGVPVVNYNDAVACDIDEARLSEIHSNVKTTDLLYVLFTSGSTGVPKGVTISHAATMDFIDWLCDRFSLDENTSLCNQAPFYFDVSLPDIYVPLKLGASSYIPPSGYYTFPKKILCFVKEHNVNTLFWVASALCNVVNCRAFDVCIPDCVKLVVFSAEVMPCKHLNVWRKHLPSTLYVNMYGPTEITCICIYYEIKKLFSDSDTLPLGRACENSSILLLKEDNTPAAPGELGEICVLGQCLSQGYYNNPEKSDEVFVQNPLNKKWSERMYRTGDLAYINPKGEIMFAGRKDFQIKRLGHWIELGEIEAAILSMAGIDNACCLFNETTSDIVAVYSGVEEEDTVRLALTEKLPHYMLPNRIIHLDALPMNLNGKIDRPKLKNEYARG